MNWKKTTQIVIFSIIGIIILILIYDAIAIGKAGTEASISSRIINASYEMPLIPFSIGFFIGLLSGHLFWRMKGNKDTKELGLDK